jgi:glycosyltransferase involved in cell wall biosynthesis
MLRVLVFVNDVSHTSIPFETTVRIATQEVCEITLVTFYGSDEEDGSIDLPFEVLWLEADSRIDLNAWRHFYQELQTGRYDVLHTHHNFTGSVARVLASTVDVGIINTEHRQHSSYTPLQNGINAPTLPLADKVVCNSLATQKSLRWYEKKMLDDEQLTMVYNGVNFTRLNDVVESINKQDTELNIVTVGRLVPVKNYQTLLEAFRLVREQIPETTLSLIGDGPLRDNLEAQAASLGLTDAVHFRGSVSREEVYKELARADLFTIPSYSEGFCVAAVEAMGAGLPVVVSDISVFHEVVGDPGAFADPNDPYAFADAITELLRSPRRSENLGEQAKQRAHSKFSIKRTAREYYNIYKQVGETTKQ